MRTIAILTAYCIFAIASYLVFKAVDLAASDPAIHVEPEAPYHPWSLCTHSTSRPPTGPVRTGRFNGSNAGMTQCVVTNTIPSSASWSATYTVRDRDRSLTSEQEEV